MTLSTLERIALYRRDRAHHDQQRQAEIIAKGWQVWGTEGNAVVLVWLHDEVPQ